MATGPKAKRKPSRAKSRLQRLYDASADILDLVPMARDIELDASIPYGISAVDHAKRVIPKIRSLYDRLNKVRDLVGDCFEELGDIALKLPTLNLNVLWTGVSGYDAALWRATDLLHRINPVCMVAAQHPRREPFDINSCNDELYAQHWQIVQCTLAASRDMTAEDMLIVRRVESEMAALRKMFATLAAGTRPQDEQPTKLKGWLSCDDIANAEKLPRDALDKRLMRFRQRTLDGWTTIESVERKQRGPKYLYKLTTIQSIIDDMKAKLAKYKRRPPSAERLARKMSLRKSS